VRCRTSTPGADRGGDRTEDEALAGARRGDQSSYEELVRRHAPVAHRTALLFGAGADADDVVQEAFVKAFRSLHRFRADSPFRPWLLSIVVNETRNLHRASRRRAVLALRVARLPVDGGAAADPLAAAADTERRTALLDAVRSLPERDRAVVTCRYLLELSEAETATALGMPVGTVKSRLSRALRKLQGRLAGLATTGEEVTRG
jgi:RNA polymerase sigma-70 factor (ECF subfamily)